MHLRYAHSLIQKVVIVLSARSGLNIMAGVIAEGSNLWQIGIDKSVLFRVVVGACSTPGH